MTKSLDELLAELGSMNYSAPSSYKGYQSTYTPAEYKNLDLSGWSLTQDDFKSLAKDKKKKKDSGIDFWGLLSGTLGQVGGAVTDQAYNVISDIKNLKDNHGARDILKLLGDMNPTNTIARGITNGAKSQWDDWTNGKANWGDVPLVGFLNGMDKGWKRGEDIAQDHLGIDNRWGKVGAGIGIDIALDPLTYLTGGLSTAGKMKKAAELAEMARTAKSMGITQKVKTADELGEIVRQTLTAKYPNLAKANSVVGKSIVDKQVDNILQKVRAAGAKAFNDNINTWSLALPKVNKTLNLGKVNKGILHRSEATVPSALVNDLIKSAVGQTGKSAKLEKAILDKYGISAVENMTKTQFDDLVGRLTPVIEKSGKVLPESLVKWSANYGETPKLADDINALLHQIENPKKSRKALEDLAPPKVTQARLPKDADVTWDKDILKVIDNNTRTTSQLSKALNGDYDKLNNAKTGFEHWLDGKNPFNARTLQTGNKFVDSMADHIADADSMRIGEKGKYDKALYHIEKFINKNKISPTEMEDAIHVLEGTFEGSPPKKIQQLAEMIKPLLDQIGADDQAAGVLDKMRKNYFPHIVNKSEDEMEKIKEFIAKREEPAKMNNSSSSSGHNKKRTSFETLKDRDKYMEDLAKQMQKETDPDELEKMQEQMDRVSKMFDTDIVSALTRRVKEGVRARAMKEMHGELSKFKMLVSNEKDTVRLNKLVKANDLVRLDPDDAKKLGLDKGQHFMNKDVLAGMKRVDEVFTQEGMNKFVRHVTAINDIFRSLVTHWKPSHYRNNIIGNIITNMAAGVGVSDYNQARKLVSRLRKGKLTKEDMSIINSAYKHNVISGGFLADAKHTYSFETPTKLEKVADKVANNKVIKWGKNKGEAIDDVTRLANYINGLKKFGTPKKAAQQVREYLFNYNELTNADRHMRVIVPFWNWMKRNVPLQMKLLMENPKFAMNNERFKNLFNDHEEGEDWQKESGIKIPFTDKYTSIPSPTADLKMFTDPLSVLGSTTPAFKIPVETSLNKKFFNNQPISYGSDNVKAKDFAEYLAKNFGIAGSAYDVGSGEKNILEALINLINPYSNVQK